MASYFNLTLDTLAPSGLSVLINGGAQYTSQQEVTLTISLDDPETSNYQMKIWGIAGVDAEEGASWETFSKTKTVNVASGDGLKTIYVKVRDDVWNESSAASDTITLNTAVPVVTITGPDVAKISKVAQKNVSSFTFRCDVKIIEWKVMVVKSNSALENTGTNKQIPTVGGSTNMTGSTPTEAETPVSCTIYGADLESASSGDGVKIVKVFAKSESGVWSVA